MKSKGQIGLYYLLLLFLIYHFLKINFFNGNEAILSLIRDFSIMVILVFLLIKRKINRIDRDVAFLLIIYLIFIAVEIIVNGSILGSILDIRYYVIWPSMFFIGYLIIEDDSVFIKIVFSIVNFALIVCMIGLYFKVTFNSEYLFYRFGDYAIKSILPTHVDFGLFMFLAMTLCLYLKSRHKIGYKKLTLYLTILSIGCFYSYSRLSYVAYIVFSVLYIGYEIIKNIYIKILFIISQIVAGIILIINSVELIASSKIMSIESLLDRINSIWANVEVKNILLGNGFGSIGVNSEYLVSNFSLRVADNLYIKTYYTVGVLGIIIMISLITLMIKKSNYNKLIIITIVSLALAGLFGDLLNIVPAIPYVYLVFGMITKLEHKNILAR